jgi:hypothetical protein
VRIDIPDENDVNFEYHGEHGMVLSRRDGVYEVALDDSNIVLEVTAEEVRPPLY